MKRRNKWLLCLAAAVLLGIGLMSFWKERWVAGAEALPLRETTEDLRNPDRGFYRIHGFVLWDDMEIPRAAEAFAADGDNALALVELNLRHYAAGDISEAGLARLADLLDALDDGKRRYILRFVYDWDGKNMETEPRSRAVVERHMAQAAPLLNEKAPMIYTLQGLFVGNWGEMNGTRYTGTDHWRALAGQLQYVTDDSLLLAVRMPMQWRRVHPESASFADSRMGLFNDGMLGSVSDLGTYGELPRARAEYGQAWQRDDELAFQEELCRYVPNGGEVVAAPEGSTLDEDIAYLRTVHVSYLNEDYDRRVLERWAGQTVSGGVWDGTDGLTYVAAHLGYRFTAERATVSYARLSNTIHVEAEVKNAGFAPAYFGLSPKLNLVRGDAVCYTFPLTGDMASLWGGAHTESVTVRTDIPLRDVEKGGYTLCLCLDSDRGEILLANEGRCAGGYPIGGIQAK